MLEIALMKGLIVQCPVCKLEICRVVKDIHRGDTLRADLFYPLVDGAVFDGGSFNCPKCNAGYFLFGKMHTKQLGWCPPG